MSRHQASAPSRLSRRSAFGLIGGAAITAGGAVVLAGGGNALAAPASKIPAESTPEPPPTLRPGGSFDRYLARQAAQDLFSGTVLISYRGNPVLAQSYGMADKQKQIPNRADTIYGLASVTKLFTATAVVQLVERGKLDLSKTLGSYLPNWPSSLAGITLHQLLTHTSGMGDYTQSPVYKADYLDWDTPEEVADGIMDIIKGMPLLFTPGTSWSYSNSGYATLAAVIGQVSGQSYAAYYDFVRTNVFAKAGMTSTDFYTSTERESDPRIAHPYSGEPGGTRTDKTSTEGYLGFGAGGALASAPDLVRYGRALFGGQLFSRPWAELMTSPKVPGTGEADGGGAQAQVSASQDAASLGAAASSGLQNQSGSYGGMAAIFNGQRIASMTGGGPGAGTTDQIDMYPDLDWDAVILMNYDNIGTTWTTLANMERQAITRQTR